MFNFFTAICSKKRRRFVLDTVYVNMRLRLAESPLGTEHPVVAAVSVVESL